MSSNSTLIPGAKEALNKLKFETASEVGVNLKNGYNGDIKARVRTLLIHTYID